MIKLTEIIDNINKGNFINWNKDFELFKNTVNQATEYAKNKFESTLLKLLQNKSITIRASRGYKQPIKDYTIKNVTAVNVNDYYNDWVVVIKNEKNKEFFLSPNYRIQLINPDTTNIPQPPTNDIKQQLPPK